MIVTDARVVPAFCTSILFIFAGMSVAEATKEPGTTNLVLAVIFNLVTILIVSNIFIRNKKRRPIFGLSLAFWIVLIVMTYGLGLSAIFLK